jgi:hypothetical protein
VDACGSRHSDDVRCGASILAWLEHVQLDAESCAYGSIELEPKFNRLPGRLALIAPGREAKLRRDRQHLGQWPIRSFRRRGAEEASARSVRVDDPDVARRAQLEDEQRIGERVEDVLKISAAGARFGRRCPHTDRSVFLAAVCVNSGFATCVVANISGRAGAVSEFKCAREGCCFAAHAALPARRLAVGSVP